MNLIEFGLRKDELIAPNNAEFIKGSLGAQNKADSRAF